MTNSIDSTYSNRYFGLVAGLLLVAFLGFALPSDSFACHKNNKPHGPNGEPCDGGAPGNGGTEVQLYDVNFSGVVSGSGSDWESTNNGKVSWQSSWGTGVGGVLDLSYFEGEFTNGTNCFGDSGLVFSASLAQQRDRSASGVIWFEGYTDDRSTLVLYRLRIDGLLEAPDNWIPSAKNTMTMTTWSMHLENQGRQVKNISCLGEGDFLHNKPLTIVIDPVSP
jgi:hypothetical protein